MPDVPRLACSFPPSKDVPHLARAAEELGYGRVWIYDSPALYGDVWVAVARAVEATETIGVATGVAVGFLRHVMVTASAIATIEDLAPGRLTFAVGTGFTGARAMGRKAMKWSDLARYVTQLRALLHGDTVEVDGARCRMIHSPGYAPMRPIDVPLLLAPMGPKGFEYARELADGVIVASPPGTDEWDPCALLCSGTVLEPGEDHTTPRVIETLAPSYATGVHARWEFARAMVPEIPGGAQWLTDLEADHDEGDRPWAVHEGHMIAVSDRDRDVVAAAGAAILQSGWTGDAASVLSRAVGAREGGVTELAYGPTGPDPVRELAAFAAAVRGGSE
jgi:5,10-methylenetetrahydromethanopterin reductase